MRKTLFTSVLLLLVLTSSAKVLIKVQFKYKLLEGHGVTMYYSVDTVDELYQYIQLLDTVTERSILASFGLPLDQDNATQENCIVPKAVRIDHDKLHSNRRRRRIVQESEEIYLQIELLKADYTLCVFPLDNKYWGSYDVNFKQAGVITSNPLIGSWSKGEKAVIKKIRKEIEVVFN